MRSPDYYKSTRQNEELREEFGDLADPQTRLALALLRPMAGRVLADGKVVGRIYEDASASTPPELRWFWSILEVIRVPGVRTHGHAPTLDESKAKFRDNWTKAALAQAKRGQQA